ncbi:MAG: DUF1343 domain-containing protein [Gemmatimonadota bacterium]|nr:DUF1343 domain-containing protein [Gemmatimonadota bacterium]
MFRHLNVLLLPIVIAVGATSPMPLAAQGRESAADRYRPGVTVLLEEQISLIRNRSIALFADPRARDERGRATASLFRDDRRLRAARVTLAGVLNPADANAFAALDTLRGPVALIVLDIVDDGWRRGPVPPFIVSALRVAAARRTPVIVLDRPNPLTGGHAEGPIPDSLAAASDALYGLPARHGMTVGELARFFNDAGAIGADLTVVPVRGWRRSWWPGENGVAENPGGADATPERLLIRGTLAPLQATNVNVAFGPARAEASIAASWLDAKRLATALADRLIVGVKFEEARGRVKVAITDRDRASSWRTVGAVLAALQRVHPDQFRFDAEQFDASVGTPGFRMAVLRGDDADAIVDRDLGKVVDFARRARGALLYR